MKYYNEINEGAAAWLRELIKAGHIAPGDVDTRSIMDVRPADLKGYTSCHFFAGIGTWSYALRRAGWADDRPVWTGSCPCQPFSAAGQGNGFDDERHLWPHFHWLIDQCRPAVVLGEQVASKDGLAWLDLVQADLEGSGYASGALDTCAAGFGAPHIRQRLYWVAYAQGDGHQRAGRFDEPAGRHGAAHIGATGRLEDPRSQRLERERLHVQPGEPRKHNAEAGRRSEAGGLGDSDGWDADAEGVQSRREQRFLEEDGSTVRQAGGGARADVAGELERPGPTNGFWGDADWLHCRDAKWRPVEPGTFPLVTGAPARMGRLRGFGNAVNAQQAQAFIEAVMAATPNELT